MASNYPSETDPIVSSSPSQSDFSPCNTEPPLQFMCSFGGQILPRKHNANQLCYVGGNTRIFTVSRCITFSSLLTELSDLSGNTEISVKYHLPNEDLGALISVTDDKGIENMMEAYRYSQSIHNVIHGSARLLRLFLFSENSSNVVSHTNGHRSEYEEVPDLVMEQNLTKLEEPKQEKLDRNANALVYHDPDPDPEPELNVEPSSNWSTFKIPSAMQNLETLWTWLNDDDVRTIKIEGGPGTGKTWIVGQIVNRARESKIFRTTCWEDESLPEWAGEWKWEWELGMHQSALKYSEEDMSKLLFVGPPSRHFKVPMDKVLEVKELSEIEDKLVFENISGLQLDDLEVCKYAQPLLQKCKGNLSMILVLAASLRRYLEESSCSLKTIDTLQKSCDLLIDRSMPIVEVVCEMLSSKQVRNCFIYFLWYFCRGKTFVDARSLIAFWILEGCLDGYNCLEDAYKRGWDILLELTDSFLLIRWEVTDYFEKRHVIGAQSCILFQHEEIIKKNVHSEVLQSSEILRYIILMNEDLKMYASEPMGFLVYGNEARAPHEIPHEFFEKTKNLRILSFQHNGFKTLPSSLSISKKLKKLILRDCTSLEDVNHISELKQLKYLDLSGASSLNELPDDFFQTQRRHLQHLNLSHTQLKKMPSSFYELVSLRYLCLQGCSRLQLFFEESSYRHLRLLKYLLISGCMQIKTIPHPDYFPKIRVLDLSGATAFKGFQCKSASKETYLHFRKVDLSGTKVVDVQFLSRCVHLRELLLKNCTMVETVPCLSREVEILDLSCSVSFKNFEDESLGDKLLCLDLSRTQIKKLPMFSIDSRLIQLLLRECADLEELPPSEFQNLEVLDLSGSINFKIFNDVSSVKLRRLRTFDLSATQISELPHLSECNRLRQLVLRNCLRLEVLPRLKELEVLDLSGSSAFRKFHNTDMEKMVNLQDINLSGTQVVGIPALDECRDLRTLILKGCSKLESLPQLEELSRLEVLDLSGSTAFRKFHNTDMEKMANLQDLNLSGTQVVGIPSLNECRDLRTLILKGCSKLESLPQLEELSRLQVLDLSGSVSFTTFQDQYLGSKYHLQILDLSETQVAELPLLSGCSNLSQLILRDCLKLKNLPPLDKHPRLEVIALSETKNMDLSILSEFQNLRQLSLRGFSSLDAVPFECMHGLEMVDISRTAIQMIPSSFYDFRNLNQLLLEDCPNVKILPQPDSLHNLVVLDISCQRASGISASVYSRFLVTLNKNFLWQFDDGKYSQRFNFCLCSFKDWGKEKDIYLQRQEVNFRDIYYQTNHIPQVTEEPDKFFKICGFQAYPVGAEGVIFHAELLYLENNDFITRLSDLGAKHVKVMKECWVESCQNMESCFHGEEEEENDALGKCLQTLWVSKLSNLECLFRDVVNSTSFIYLKNLYIECCPSLITLCSSHLEMKYLDTLKIKFCDKLENVSGDMVLAEQTFPRLKMLTLWKLPKLHRVCTGALPSLECLAVKRCPKLEKLPLSLNSTSRSLKIKGEKLWWDNLNCEDDTIKSLISFTELPQFL